LNLLYVDESGDTSLKGSRHLLLGAAALFEGKWRQLREDLDQLIERYFPNLAFRPSEIHCTDLRRGKKEYSHLSSDERKRLFADLCRLVNGFRESEVTLFAVAYDKRWWFARNPGKSGDDLYIEAFENLVSRFDLFLKRRHSEGRSSKGLIIADPRNSAFSAALRRALIGFQDSGTRWARLENIVESVLFLGSHESPGLQVADLCSYAVWRLVEYSDAALAEELRYVFDREPLSSRIRPGEWHGIRYYGNDRAIHARIREVWR
jgi:hypothetical protein